MLTSVEVASPEFQDIEVRGCFSKEWLISPHGRDTDKTIGLRIQGVDCDLVESPGGAPMSLLTVCRSMYSLMSSRIMVSSLPK